MTPNGRSPAIEETAMRTASAIHLPVVRYREGRQPTCAVDFETGDVCKFYRTQRLGIRGNLRFCRNADTHSKFADNMMRRDGRKAPDMGSLIPGDWCPVWEPTKRNARVTRAFPRRCEGYPREEGAGKRRTRKRVKQMKWWIGCGDSASLLNVLIPDAVFRRRDLRPSGC